MGVCTYPRRPRYLHVTNCLPSVSDAVPEHPDAYLTPQNEVIILVMQGCFIDDRFFKDFSFRDLFTKSYITVLDTPLGSLFIHEH